MSSFQNFIPLEQDLNRKEDEEISNLIFPLESSTAERLASSTNR